MKWEVVRLDCENVRPRNRQVEAALATLETMSAKIPRETATKPNNNATTAPIALPNARKAEAKRTSRKTEVTTTAGSRGLIDSTTIR